ncbi:hypothetical protein [Bordetella avium]|uniref:hypothetical protein n=1 Tax=Bordetella avium TaxID=521 RepID=UPI000E0CA4AD|nr:hypothetical protein [Bordetella avium]RIQ58915.1 hypothetical protein D0840_16880 [Bordetella avium]WQE34258.1 hypothetical protein U0029_03515 [Bordetella avium]SUV67851.1 phage protein [Bordetella avium]
MAKIALRVDERGKLAGLTPFDDRAYSRFKKKLGLLRPGDTISFEHRFPRSPKFHRLHFALLGAIFDNQDQFVSPEDLRKWVEVGAGHCRFVPGPKGRLVALPLSISYESLDDAEFYDHHIKVVEFLRSQAATRFLWPDVDDSAALAGIEAILAGFGA